MGLGKLRNQPCPCNSGKKYKKCHWPMPWRNVRLAQVSLTENVPGRPLPAYKPPEPSEIERQVFGGGGEGTAVLATTEEVK